MNWTLQIMKLKLLGKPRFIIIESNNVSITKLSTFIIEKVISTNLTPITVKKLKMKLLVEVVNRKHTDFVLKMTKFHKAYLHKSLYISKGVVRSKEVSLCTVKEIKRELKKRGVTEVKRVSVNKEVKTIKMNTYIMNF